MFSELFVAHPEHVDRREEPELRPTALEVWESPRFAGLVAAHQAGFRLSKSGEVTCAILE